MTDLPIQQEGWVPRPKAGWHWRTPVVLLVGVGAAGLILLGAIGAWGPRSSKSDTSTTTAVASSISPGVISALTQSQSISLTTPASGVTPSVSASAALEGNVLSAGDVAVEQLLDMTGAMTGGSPELVWVIQESLTSTAGQVSSAALAPGGSPEIATADFNTRLDFVDADTGSLVFSSELSAPAS
ncbi:MAG: hypothetical protein ACRD0Z_06095 [Acidimicrobiales bacterium]